MAMAPSVVRIDESDAERATVALSDANDASLLSGNPRPCPTCGETVEPRFAQCWQCGREVSDDA